MVMIVWKLIKIHKLVMILFRKNFIDHHLYKGKKIKIKIRRIMEIIMVIIIVIVIEIIRIRIKKMINEI